MIRFIVFRTVCFLVSIKDGIKYSCNFISSLVFNFFYLPYKQAVHMPIWVESLKFGRYAILGGKISIETNSISYKMIRLGARFNSWYPYSGIVLQNFGEVIFKGKCIIGNDSCIYVKDGCKLVIGDDVIMTAAQKIICENGITIGEHTRFGWNSLLMDTNFHYMTNIQDGSCNTKISAPIKIGNHNWFGNGCTIFKGFTTTDFVTIGSGSKCRGSIDKEYSVWSNDGKLHLIGEHVYRDLTKDPDMFRKNI